MRAVRLTALLVVCVACGGSAPAVLAPRGAGDAWAAGSEASPDAGVVGDYVAAWDPASGLLRVEARLTAAAGATLAVERGAERFLEGVEASADREGAPWVAVSSSGPLEAAPCGVGPCRIRYRYALRDAAARLDDLDVASEESGLLVAPPSTWLLAPARGRPHEQRVRFRVTTPPGSRFVTGVFRSPTAPEAWEIALDDLWTSPYSAFGPVRTLPVAGSAFQLAMSPGNVRVGEEALVRWSSDAERAVTGYFGRFPMPGALVLLAVTRGRWVGSGRTLAGGGGAVFVRVGERAPAEAYRADWVLVHELVHLAFPSVAREHAWAEEGIATYVEPFARVRAGLLSEEEAWQSFAEGLPNGLPRPGDRGLDHTHTWGRTYWGGALFWLLADVAIHERTQNRQGLEHALRAVVAAGGTNAVRWSLLDVMKVGDAATGTTALMDLYAAMKGSPHPVDLTALLASLGIARDRATLDDRAPLAAVRRAITYGR